MAFQILDRAVDQVNRQVSIVKGNDVKSIVKKRVTKTVLKADTQVKSLAKTVDGHLSSMISTLKSLDKQNGEISERIQKLESTSGGRKSLFKQVYQERFQKSEDGRTNENTFNVKNSDDLSRLSDRLLAEHEKLIEKGNPNEAALIEGTINHLEINKAVPVFAFKKLNQLGIRLISDTPIMKSNHLFARKNDRNFKAIFGLQ